MAMKKQLLLLTFVSVLLFSNRIASQVFNFSISPTNLCQNSNAIAAVTATAPMASYYIWVVSSPAILANAVPNGSVASITFTTCGTHTVYCYAFTTTSIQVGQVTNTVFVSCNTANTITISSTAANSTICSGNSATLSALGGTSYTWFPGAITNASTVVTPVSNSCYTLMSANINGCTTMSTICIGVLPSPTLVVSGNGTVCAGGSLTLALMGALSYSLAPPGVVVGGTVIITPSVTTTYTLDGCGFACCAPTTVFGATVMPAPNLVIAGSNTVCEGSSVTYTASGANSYTWFTNPAVYTSTLNVLPISNTNYQVVGSASNGCNGSAFASLTVDTTCANVWPGDANRDGIVSNTDVLELGLAAGHTGPARSPTSIAWSAQYASAWTGTISTGWNKAHADCNGNGIINANDTTAISQNFSLSHSFKETTISSANPDIHLLPSLALAYAGVWNKVEIHLGDATNTINQVYGLAFDLNFDESLVQTDSVKITYTPSFLNAASQNIDFGKTVFSNGKFYAASVRVDHANVSGNGKIGEFWYKLNHTVPAASVINLSISNAIKINNTGNTSVLSTGATSLSIVNSGVGLHEIFSLENSVSIYPNPASRILTLQNTSGSVVSYAVVDVLGRKVLKGNFAGSKTLDVETLQPGTYFILFESNRTSLHKKLVIEKH
jgi:hypothetical protein